MINERCLRTSSMHMWLCLVTFVKYLTCEHDILSTDEPTLMPFGTSGSG